MILVSNETTLQHLCHSVYFHARFDLFYLPLCLRRYLLLIHDTTFGGKFALEKQKLSLFNLHLP